MVQSIVTVVQRRNMHGHDLALEPRQRAWSVHQLQIELIVLAHQCRMNAMNLQNIVVVLDAISVRDVGVRRVGNVSHVVSSLTDGPPFRSSVSQKPRTIRRGFGPGNESVVKAQECALFSCWFATARVPACHWVWQQERRSLLATLCDPLADHTNGPSLFSPRCNVGHVQDQFVRWGSQAQSDTPAPVRFLPILALHLKQAPGIEEAATLHRLRLMPGVCEVGAVGELD